MAKPAHTIDPSYYEGRDFTPRQDKDFRGVETPGKIETKIGNDGVLCIQFRTDATCRIISVSVAPNPSPPNVAQKRISSISKTAADFSSGAAVGTDGTIKGKIGATGQDAQVYFPMEPNVDYFYNIANAKPSKDGGTGGEMRVQVSTSP